MRKIWYRVTNSGIENKGHDDGEFRTFQALRREYPEQWFNDFAAAKAELIRRREAQLAKAQDAYNLAMNELEKARDITAPSLIKLPGQ